MGYQWISWGIFEDYMGFTMGKPMPILKIQWIEGKNSTGSDGVIFCLTPIRPGFPVKIFSKTPILHDI
jgi:hypothetical protein